MIQIRSEEQKSDVGRTEYTFFVEIKKKEIVNN